MTPFKEDRIANEKNDPIEGNTLKFINVPLVLLAAFVAFGISYLTLRTDKITMEEGDSRTTPVAQNSAATGGGAPAAAPDDHAALIEKGKQVFTTTCQACHQADGKGIASVFPPLAGSEWVQGPPKRMVAIVLHGLEGAITVEGQKFQNLMPPFQQQLTHDDIAAVVSYVRSSFGNTAPAISKELVEEVAEQTKARTSSWKGEEELNAQDWGK
jgi:mono/diheme cytochrome c family protein